MQAQLDAAIDAALGSRIVGCVVLVSQTGREVYARAAGLADNAALASLETAWRLEQDLSQLLKVALEDGGDPEAEPKAFLVLLARAGQVRAFRSLKTKLTRAKVEARAAFETIVRRDGKSKERR